MTNVTNAWAVLRAFREGYAAGVAQQTPYYTNDGTHIPGWGVPGCPYANGTDQSKAWGLGFKQGKNQKA